MLYRDFSATRDVLFIDAEKISPDFIRDFLARLSDSKKALEIKAYADWNLPKMKAWKEAIDDLGHDIIRPVQPYGFNLGRSVTVSTLTTDAFDILNDPNVSNFYLSTSTNEFAALLAFSKNNGKPITCIKPNADNKQQHTAPTTNTSNTEDKQNDRFVIQGAGENTLPPATDNNGNIILSTKAKRGKRGNSRPSRVAKNAEQRKLRREEKEAAAAKEALTVQDNLSNNADVALPEAKTDILAENVTPKTIAKPAAKKTTKRKKPLFRNGKAPADVADFVKAYVEQAGKKGIDARELSILTKSRYRNFSIKDYGKFRRFYEYAVSLGGIAVEKRNGVSYLYPEPKQKPE